ncbi:MAG: hypothetical protein ACR2G1_03570, partial [Rubrobacteraceae bacterium]
MGGETRRIGEILVDQGKVTEEQVNEALEIQKTDSRSLGKIMVAKGFITNDDLAVALAMRLDVEFVDLAESSVDQEMLELFDEVVLQQHNAVPLKIEHGRLLVAMSSPNDLFARSDLTISAGYPVTPVIASHDSIQLLHERVFGSAKKMAEPEVGEPEPLSAKAMPRPSNGASSRRS